MDLDIKFLLFIGSAFVCSILLTICVFLVAVSNPYPIVNRSKKEKCFVDAKTKELQSFPSIVDKSTVHLSVIVPAYNEESRLSPMLDECTEFLENRFKDSEFRYEIIVVSDGSKDNTVLVAMKYCEKLGTEKFRVLDLETNRGKGGAVRLGMQSARGAVLLFADADGATKFADLIKLEQSLNDVLKRNYSKEPDKVADELLIAVGSRAHLESESVAKRIKHIKDTQCGFKLLTRNAARICFDNLHVERWAFDAELLYIAKCLNIPVTEIAVNWTEIEGSKLIPIWSWIQMGKDLFLIWLRYQIGAWKIIPTKKD